MHTARRRDSVGVSVSVINMTSIVNTDWIPIRAITDLDLSIN